MARSEYLTPEYARYCLRSMAEQLHEKYPTMSAEQIVSLLLDVSTVLMSEYAKFLVSDGYLNREEAEQVIRLVFAGLDESGTIEQASM